MGADGRLQKEFCRVPIKEKGRQNEVRSPGRKSLRGVGLAFINAYSAYRRRSQSRIGDVKQRRINRLRAGGKDLHCNLSQIAALFLRYFLR
jgi:hypothetical protein